MALIVIKIEKTSVTKLNERIAGLSSQILGKALYHNNEKVIYVDFKITGKILHSLFVNTLQ